MTRYRKKPVEVEAWQVGSDEPMPEWVQRTVFMAHPIDGYWLIREEQRGHVYVDCVPLEEFEQTYEVVE